MHYLHNAHCSSNGNNNSIFVNYRTLLAVTSGTQELLLSLLFSSNYNSSIIVAKFVKASVDIAATPA